VKASLDLVEIKPGVRFSLATLRDLLLDTETILFFGKVYDLNAQQLGSLLYKVLRSDLASALFAEGDQHSNALQSYIEDLDFEYEGELAFGDETSDPVVPHGEILTHVWDQLEVTVAQSIKDVATKLESVVAMLPSKEGHMVFRSMMTMNAKRPTLGDFKAGIAHARQAENLLILDVSGSMTESTIARIINDVVALSYSASAHMAVVSNTCTYWTAGSYGVDDVLKACEYGGTQYDQLVPLFDRDWGTVITVADYDSYVDARVAIGQCSGRIETLLDVSLVNRPTFLAECVGQLANEVRPILIGSSHYVLA
jgi:hypothetical protein